MREALCCVDDLVQRQIFPPQVTLAAHRMGQDGNYPITLEEAVDYFGVNPYFHAVIPIYEITKTCFTFEKYNCSL